MKKDWSKRQIEQRQIVKIDAVRDLEEMMWG